MTSSNRIVECVPNFSEGRNQEKVEKIITPFRKKAAVKLLDYQTDSAHNRMVVTVIGEPQAMISALIEAVGVAVTEIDMNTHQGEHPRMGAVDVVPFIPIKNLTMEETVCISK